MLRDGGLCGGESLQFFQSPVVAHRRGCEADSRLGNGNKNLWNQLKRVATNFERDLLRKMRQQIETVPRLESMCGSNILVKRNRSTDIFKTWKLAKPVEAGQHSSESRVLHNYWYDCMP
jgi:hypothetical protein